MQYNFEIDETQVKVSEYELERMYDEISQAETLNQSRAKIIAEKKAIAAKCRVIANAAFYTGLMLAGELTIGQPLYFRVKHSEMWNVTITRRDDGKYNLFAFTLQRPAEHTRTFPGKEAAILFCVNNFNDNVAVPNLCQNTQELIHTFTKPDNGETKEEALAKHIEHVINNLNFDNKQFAENIRIMHPTLQQSFFRLIKDAILFMADPQSHYIDGRNRAAHEISKKLVPILQEQNIPFI